jgi:hypothetical protein
VDESYIQVTIGDRGQGFDLEQWLSQVNPLSLSEGERGIFLIAALMDEVDYRRTDRGGHLTMRKHCPSSPHADREADRHGVPERMHRAVMEGGSHSYPSTGGDAFQA